MRYLAGFLLFLSMVNLKSEVTSDVTQLVFLFRLAQMFLKSVFIVVNINDIILPKSVPIMVFIAFIFWRILDINLELEPVLLGIEFLVNIMFLIVYVNWIGKQGLKYLVLPLYLLLIYSIMGYLLYPNLFRVRLSEGWMLKSTIPALNPNAFGQIGVICLLYSTQNYSRLLGLMAIILSRSRAAVFFILYWFYTTLERRRKIFLLISLGLTFLILGNVVVFYIRRG